MNNQVLKYLNLGKFLKKSIGDNNIGDIGAKYLSGALEKNLGLVELNLGIIYLLS